MTRLDPIFAVQPQRLPYLESAEFASVRIADLEEQIEELTAQAIEKRRQIPILEREATECERDAAIAKLKLLDLKAEITKRQAANG